PPEVVERNDVRVRERRHGLGLALEARERVGALGELGRENLDGDVAVQTRVPRPVDLAHPACAERRKDLEGAEPRPGDGRHDESSRRAVYTVLLAVPLTRWSFRLRSSARPSRWTAAASCT